MIGETSESSCFPYR